MKLSHAFAFLAAIGLAFSSAPSVMADEGGDKVTVKPSGQYMSRFRHTEGKDFVEGGVHNFVTHRARIGLRLDYQDYVGVFLQAQDVRVWGSETNTLGDFSADGLDMHQAYVDIKPMEGLKLRIGRQEIAFLNHRIIGTVGWLEQARSFDAARLMYACPEGKLAADLFYARVLDGTSAAAGKDVIAFNAKYKLSPAFVPAILAVIDLDAPTERTRFTVGTLLTGKLDFGLNWTVEGYFQGGSGANDMSISAFMAAVRLKYTIAHEMKPFIEVFAEMLSGDDDGTDTDIKSFDTLFATNHKFYGEMDFFLNLPGNTAQRGLMDIGGTLGAKVHPNVLTQATVHLFSAMDDQGGEGAFGTEIDVKVAWKPFKHLGLDLVYGVFLPGDGFTGGNDDAGAEHFVYSTANANF